MKSERPLEGAPEAGNLLAKAKNSAKGRGDTGEFVTTLDLLEPNQPSCSWVPQGKNENSPFFKEQENRRKPGFLLAQNEASTPT